MPMEKVFGEQMGTLLGPDFKPLEEQPTPTVPIVEVRWNRDAGYVQVVSKATAPDDGRVVGDSGESDVTDGYHVDLGRDAINRLIRNLRRARDQVFGRDE